MITAVAFTPDGSRVAVGLFRGQVFFYKTEDLKIETQIVCTKSSAKRKIKYGYKVTGLVFRIIDDEHQQRKGETDAYELLVTTNDSSIRLYQVKDLSLTTKFKGFVNKTKPIRASFSNHGHHIICGSDTTGVFIWKIPKRRHMETKREKNANARREQEREREQAKELERSQSPNNGGGGGGGHDVDGDDVDTDKEAKATDDQMRARFESMYYSKKYEVYKKYEKLICEDNFKHLCTTVAIFAPPSALREAAAHWEQSRPPTLFRTSVASEREREREEEEERRRHFNTVIFDAEMNGTIRIIRGQASSLL